MIEGVAVDFESERNATSASIVAAADRYLGALPVRVSAAIRYALSGEGKRLRAILLLSAYRAAGGSRDASGLAAAIEIVHAYSLVHDDLPCMDDDDMRRGRPTVHKAFDVSTATAAGLTMVPMAARVALEGARRIGLDDQAAADIVRELMRASGPAGMIGGQLLDLEGEGVALTLEQLERVHSLKTGALIAAAARLGGLAACADDRQVSALDRFGRCVGLAFQIADDILDLTGTTDQLGKTAGRDLALQKSTYPSLLGLPGAVVRANALAEEGCAALSAAGMLTAKLEYLARFSVSRNK